MTFCFGAIHRGHVFLLADTAITRAPGSPLPKLPRSATGEVHFVHANGWITDEVQSKLVFLGNNCFAAISGDVERAAGAVDTLREVLRHTPIPEALSQLGASLDHKPSRGFELLLARHEGEPRLWHWSSNAHSQVDVVDGICSIGSLPRNYDQLIHALHEQMHRDTPPEHLLGILCATMQALSAREFLVQHGIGGCFVGLALNMSGTIWMHDTNYILLDTGHSSVEGMISIAVRDDCPAIRSDFLPSLLHLSGLLDTEADKAGWAAKHRASLEASLGEWRARLWVFLNPPSGSYLIVDAIESRPDIPGYFVRSDHTTFRVREPLASYLALPTPVDSFSFGFVPIQHLADYLRSTCDLHHATLATRTTGDSQVGQSHE